MTLGANITKCRMELGLTIEELRDLSQVSLSTLRALEADAIRVPNIMTVQRIAEALGVDKRYLLESHLREALTTTDCEREHTELGPLQIFLGIGSILAFALWGVYLSALILSSVLR